MKISMKHLVALLAMSIISCENPQPPGNAGRATSEQSISDAIVFGASQSSVKIEKIAGEDKRVLTPLDWELAKKMLAEQLAKRSMMVQTVDNNGSEGDPVPVVGFKVEMDVLKKLLLTPGNTLDPSVEGLFLMPAIRPCDTGNTTSPKYSTIVVGAIKNGKLIETDLYDYFKPCPDKCPTLHNGIRQERPSAGYSVHQCRP